MSALALKLVALYRREPARVNAALATLLGPLLLRVGLDVDDATTLAVSAALLNVLAGELTRRLVTPEPTVVSLLAEARRPLARGGVVVTPLGPLPGEYPYAPGQDPAQWSPRHTDVEKPQG